jgi:hypothetical protein
MWQQVVGARLDAGHDAGDDECGLHQICDEASRDSSIVVAACSCCDHTTAGVLIKQRTLLVDGVG